MRRRIAWIVWSAIAASACAAAELPNSSGPMPPMPIAGSAGGSELVRAADCIDRGDLPAALDILTRQAADHPEQYTVRAYLAELLWRLGRLPDAQAEFGRFVADAQANRAEPSRLIHAHARLAAIAEKLGDDTARDLHRGIALVWLARRETDEAKRERLLCKAAGELVRVARSLPDDPRPQWYLFEVWSALDLEEPARKALRSVARLASGTGLTATEYADFAVARDEMLVGGSRVP